MKSLDKKLETIKNQLKEQYSDESTIDTLAQYVIEAEKTFGKYISTEEIIQRLKKNIKTNFEYVDGLINGRLDGQYDNENQKVIISNNQDSSYMSFVLFHELTHAITTKQLPDGREIMGFSFLTNSIGAGLNEATTDWLAVRRNKILNVNHETGYDVIIDQIKILSQIIGEDNLFHYFFYEPENLRELLAQNNIDFDQINYIYVNFSYDRVDIYNLAQHRNPTDICNYREYELCEKLLKIYTNSIGEIKDINDFRKKYEILCSYETDRFNINNIISCDFYSMVYDDTKKLISKGEDKKQIEELLNDFKFNKQEITQAKKYQNILSNSKNEAITQIYKNATSDKNSYGHYVDFATKNKGLLYDKFDEDNFIPNENCLNDVDRYVVIGKFISEHPEYDFDEISTILMPLSNDTYIYRFETASNEVFYYDIPFKPIEKKNDNTVEVHFENSKVEISIDLESNQIKTRGDKTVTLTPGSYYKESQIESFKYQMDNNSSEAERAMYKEKYESAMQKVINRKKAKGRE